jgi:hypothetical protein
MSNELMFYAFVAVVAFSFANGAWILHRLQAAHRAIWVGLGQPTATLSSGVRPRLALVRYIWSLRFRVLGDPPLSLACWAAIVAEIFIIVLFPLLLAGL